MYDMSWCRSGGGFGSLIQVEGMAEEAGRNLGFEMSSDHAIPVHTGFCPQGL